MLDKYKVNALFTESAYLEDDNKDFSISYIGKNITYPKTAKYTVESGSMQDSYVYKVINKNDYVINMFTKFLGSSIMLTKENIEEQYIHLKRMSSSPLNKKVMEAFDEGYIELAYSNSMATTNIFPYIIRKNSNGKIVATILVSTFGKLNSDGNNLNIPIKNLYALMEAAYIALKLTLDGLKISRNSNLMRFCAMIYTEMIIRCINKDFAIMPLKDVYAKVVMSISYFFLVNIWGMNKDMAVSYAYNITQDRLGQSYNIGLANLDDVIVEFDSKNIVEFPELIDFIRDFSPRMSSLTVRYFLERYMNTYNPSATLSLDYLPMLFYVISATLTGSFIVNQASLGDLVKNTKGVNSYYSELSRL